MQIVNNEFFYSSEKFNDGEAHHDFTDNTPAFSSSDRLNFLTNYADFVKKAYDLPDKPEVVFSEEQAKAELSKALLNEAEALYTKKHYFKEMNAKLEYTPSQKGWHLYSRYAKIEENQIVFEDTALPPTPSALYSFEGALKEFEFSVYIDSKYKCFIGQMGEVVSARGIELRSGIYDVAKLHFYANGEFHARYSKTNEYNLDSIFIGNFEYDKWQKVKVILSEDEFYVIFNGNKVSVPYTYNMKPNRLFVGSGIMHFGKWRFCPEKMVFDDGEITDFFIEKSEQTYSEEIGRVSLPYRIGTEKNANKALILEESFYAPQAKKASICVSSLDPYGEVYINGRQIIKTDGFDRQELDITEFISFDSQNDILIRVEARAPETLCNWHRQTDNYTGWFCEDVTITYTNEHTISDILVITEKVGEKIDFSVSADVSSPFAKIFVGEIYPEKKTEIDLGTFSVKNGKLLEHFSEKLKPWSCDEPIIYSVRVCAVDNGVITDDEVIETGFRTIEQKNGDVLLNGEKIVLSGALLMQYLPPHEETAATHICPRNEQVWQQQRLCKLMGGNTLRLHILGYGTNDIRYAKYADRMGLMLIWITRYIDSAEQMVFDGVWHSKNGYLSQIAVRRNHPSIIMWEGSNEYHASLENINDIYRQFVPEVKKLDTTRLICPVSHLYYAADSYAIEGCGYYDDSGLFDHDGNPLKAPDEWNDPLVVRSAHTYIWLLGYGEKWKSMREQDWSIQDDMFNSKKHAYIVSEYAVIGRQDPTTELCKKYYNPNSYELGDEAPLGIEFNQSLWRESQAYQALAAKVDTQVLRLRGADGMWWCCLMSGANNGSYLKPPIDFCGYPKLAFYTLRESFAQTQVLSSSLDVLKPREFEIEPVIVGAKKDTILNIRAEIFNQNGDIVADRVYSNICSDGESTILDAWKISLEEDGYYHLKYTMEA